LSDAGGLAATNGMVTTTGTASDVYPIIYVAKESYGLVPLKGSKCNYTNCVKCRNTK